MIDQLPKIMYCPFCNEPLVATVVYGAHSEINGSVDDVPLYNINADWNGHPSLGISSVYCPKHRIMFKP